jgi:hypothetical protein
VVKRVLKRDKKEVKKSRKRKGKGRRGVKLKEC